tara:strand:- start:621 stop:1304 length:684 start_codon:yes stop_codon:yes gene_type:complete
MTYSAIILAAGLGTRMKEYTREIPKSLIKVHNKPMIDYAIDILKILEITNIYINVHYKSEILKEYIEYKKKPNLKISDESDELLDTGGAIKKIFVDHSIENALVLNSDVIWREKHIKSFREMISRFNSKSTAILGIIKSNQHNGYTGKGDFCIDKNNLLSRYNNLEGDPYNYIGSQIISREAFKSVNSHIFSINLVWDELITRKELEGFKFDVNVLHVGNRNTLKSI